MKTNLIDNFEENYFVVGDDIVVNWPEGRNSFVKLSAKILCLESKSILELCCFYSTKCGQSTKKYDYKESF